MVYESDLKRIDSLLKNKQISLETRDLLREISTENRSLRNKIERDIDNSIAADFDHIRKSGEYYEQSHIFAIELALCDFKGHPKIKVKSNEIYYQSDFRIKPLELFCRLFFETLKKIPGYDSRNPNAFYVRGVHNWYINTFFRDRDEQIQVTMVFDHEVMMGDPVCLHAIAKQLYYGIMGCLDKEIAKNIRVIHNIGKIKEGNCNSYKGIRDNGSDIARINTE